MIAQTGAGPVDRSNSDQSTEFDIFVVAHRGLNILINRIRIAACHDSTVSLACGHTPDSLQTDDSSTNFGHRAALFPSFQFDVRLVKTGGRGRPSPLPRMND